jgi:uncharacterized protein
MSAERSFDRDWSTPSVAAAARFAISKMSGNDGSHDHHHALRVHALALRIAEELTCSSQGLQIDREVIEIGALLHDIYDPKLWKPDPHNLNVKTSAQMLAEDLATNLGVQNALVVDRVVKIAEGISYSKQQSNRLSRREHFVEMDVVQDADRLEAIGAIGLARCFAFGGLLQRPLEDSRRHYDEKLCKLKDTMRTVPGARMAVEKANFMRQFIEQYDDEMLHANVPPPVRD